MKNNWVCQMLIKIDSDIYCSGIIVVVFDSDGGVVFGEEVRDGFTPFDDYNIIGVFEIFF